MGETAPVAAAAPVQRGERIESLDVMRGVALLGILLMNIIAFGAGLFLFVFRHAAPPALERFQLYCVVAGIWAFQLVLSPIWLRHFRPCASYPEPGLQPCPADEPFKAVPHLF